MFSSRIGAGIRDLNARGPETVVVISHLTFWAQDGDTVWASRHQFVGRLDDPPIVPLRKHHATADRGGSRSDIFEKSHNSPQLLL
jgi:hypothetical protein